MCIICVKNANIQLPTEEQLRNCEDRNKDGMGIAYLKAGETEIRIKKDFDKIDTFIKWFYDNIKIEDRCIVHFRFATHGLKDYGNRHPFPITKNKKLMREVDLICNMAVAHNGVISQYQRSDKFSDTQKFIEDILADDSVKNNLENDTIRKLVGNFLGSDRLSVMQNDGKIFLWGEWKKEKELYFSNDGYKKIEYKFDNYRYDNWKNNNKTTKLIQQVDICDGCKEKHLLMEIEDCQDGVWFLCKKCRKKLRKGQLFEGVIAKTALQHNTDVGIQGMSSLEQKLLSEDQCESCYEWFERKLLLNYYGTKLCDRCYGDLPKY